MSYLFLSHSSADDSIASQVREWLRSEGHESIFLDHDAADGIVGGEPWEDRLQTELRRCRALIVLLSPLSLASPWCAAEATHAEAQHKPVIPLRIADIAPELMQTAAPPVIRRQQIIDWQSENWQARLRRALESAGLDAKNQFVLKDGREPYPGLVAFERDDAAVYFGRKQEVTDLLSLLRECQAPQRARLVIIEGPSGTGKSSLLRAGVLPVLERDADRWIVLPPFRPLQDPVGGLIEVFAAANGSAPAIAPPARSEDEHAWAKWIVESASVLRVRAHRLGASVLLAIDQLEEALVDDSIGSDTFLLALRNAFALSDHRFIVLATLRADFGGRLTEHRALSQPPHEPTTRHDLLSTATFPLGPMSRRSLHTVIEDPAKLVDLELQAGFTSRLMADVDTDDALPLLAFVLNDLWLRYGRARRSLSIEDYERHGGLEAAVGQRAEQVMAAARPTAEELDAFRITLLFQLADLSSDGRVLRRQAPLKDIPANASRLTEAFVGARLLKKDERHVEVAHEALFRHWNRLRSWIEEASDDLRARGRLENAHRAWHDEGVDKESRLLQRGRPLEEARELLLKPQIVTDSDLRDFVEASLAAGAAQEKREALRSQKELERLREEQVRTRTALDQLGDALDSAVRRALIAVVAAIAAIGFAGAAFWLLREARSQGEGARMASVVRVAASLADVDHTLAASLLATLSAEREPEGALRLAIRLAAESIATVIPEGMFEAAFSPDGTRVVLLGRDDVKVWHTDGRGEPVSLRGSASVVAFSPDSVHVLGVGPQAATVWRADGVGEPQVVSTAFGSVKRARFSPDGSRVIVVTEDFAIHVWRTDADSSVVRYGGPTDRLVNGSLSRDGRLVAAALDGTTKVWRLDAKDPPLVLRAEDGPNCDAHFSPDDAFVISVSCSGDLRKWRADGDGTSILVGRHRPKVFSLAFSNDGSRIVTGGFDNSARVWRVDDPGEPEVFNHGSSVYATSFSSDNRHVHTASADGLAHIWPLDRRLSAHVIRTGVNGLNGSTLSSDGSLLAAPGNGSTTRIWRMVEPSGPVRLEGAFSSILSADISRDGTRVVVSDAKLSARLWRIDRSDTELVASTDSRVRLVAFTPDDRQIITVGLDGIVRVQRLDGSTPARVVRRDVGPVGLGAFSPDRTHAITMRPDRSVVVWRVDGAGEVTVIPATGAVLSVALSPDNLEAAVVTEDGKLRLYQTDGTKSHREISSEEFDEFDFVAFSDGGRRLIASTQRGTTRAWAAAVLRDPVTLPFEIRGNAAFSPDHTRVATGDGAGVIRLWRADGSGEPALLTTKSNNGVALLAFSADGRALLSVHNQGTVQVWRAAWPPVLENLQSLTRTSCLTVEERRQYLGDGADAAMQARNACIASQRQR